jgi:hypothetical protein
MENEFVVTRHSARSPYTIDTKNSERAHLLIQVQLAMSNHFMVTATFALP